MKLFKVLFILLIILFIGGFAYVAMSDVDIQQSEIQKEIKIEALNP